MIEKQPQQQRACGQAERKTELTIKILGNAWLPS
jgi:hypothetical protein